MLSDANLRAWLRFFFAQADMAPPLQLADIDAWFSWLTFHQLAPYAWERLQSTRQLDTLPSEAVTSLRQLVFPQAAVAATRRHALLSLLRAFQQAGIETVLLKGVALTFGRAYANPAWRIMADYDFWVQPAQMSATVELLKDLGYADKQHPQRPLALRMAEQEEITMVRTETLSHEVDLHYWPFLGAWLSAAMPPGENEAIWQRRQTISEDGVTVYRLAAEDNLIHLATHIAVSHQMGSPALRSFWDVATSLRAWPVDWEIIVERAQRWHVQTVLFVVLNYASEWTAASVPAYVLDALRPSRLHLALLEYILPAEEIMRGTELSTSHRRYIYLLALLDQPQAGWTLARQALLPHQEWLRLRYDADAADPHRFRVGLYLRHFWQVLRNPRF